ncbi:TRAP transporter permease [Rhodoferax sp.]|uniref:TRAP transporter permease n=1 Tax=Rhodoferax sp. TaxID=50421 RepID=UPI002720B21E|nr:TRAP transporter permease [Rhodoferax sp.]MDO9144434.1 TRAP transporter permease [Rhodoferax sp.]MDP1530822.1 TRAP transporter permease [Rhodoferax sp.]MDP1945156.1 TRAP transporter permease [Rhodoferax sp.]MDP2442885.1 TRAP transporter permease [Rhodoferax sp.]MDP3191164.1 TRAP transporter permease [Rhodoferax sp.]
MSHDHESPIKTMGRAIFWAALLFSSFQLITAAFSPLSSQVVRAVHVGFVLLLIYALFPPFEYSERHAAKGRVLGWLLGLTGFVFSLYHWLFEADLTQRAGELIAMDWVIGVVTVALVFEAARRVMGWGLPIICGVFLLYGLFGQYLPGDLAHRGFGVDQIVSTLAFGTEGIYGTPTYVSSSYIFLFILFGAFLEQAGMINLFNDFAMGMVGHTRGGPAKVSVISSGLMGTINGSGVANVVTTGQFTIPLMKRFGYSPAFAGGVEATSSMGGQIMPPVMGAVAFIMAETINVPYVAIVKAALIPAILYFVTAFWMVHLEAGRKGLNGLPKDQCPNPWTAVRLRWYLLLPLVGLVVLLFSGYTPLFSGTVGLALTVVLIFGAAVMTGVSNLALRGLFWALLGLASAGFFEFGVGTFFVIVALLVAFTLIRRVGGDARRLAVRAMVDGARHALPVAIACALVGVIIGMINLTGVAAELGGKIIAVGEESLFLALLLTMLICLVLGMGIPTIPNYIITSSLAAPVLLKLGVPLLVSHMFVFYFGIMADLTPPVALAAFAAAPIAGVSGLKISIQALRVAIAGFIVPFMAVYSPALMLQSGDWLDTTWIVFKALVAIAMWGAGAIGFLITRLNPVERVVAIGSASLLVVALPLTDELGLGLIAAFVAWHVWRSRAK